MIVKHWRRGKGYQYFIKWKGYPIEEATWELEANISKDGDMLTRYKLRHQLWNNTMIKTIIKKAKSWSFLWSPQRNETDHSIPPVPSFEPPLIVVCNPRGRRVEDLDANYKETHPFHRLNKQELEHTPLSNIFPNLFYKEKWRPTFLSPHLPFTTLKPTLLLLIFLPPWLITLIYYNPNKPETSNLCWLSWTLARTSRSSWDC